MGTRSAFTVDRVNAPSKEAAIQAISASALQSHTNIFKVQAGDTDSFQSRTLFAFIGNRDAFARSGG